MSAARRRLVAGSQPSQLHLLDAVWVPVNTAEAQEPLLPDGLASTARVANTLSSYFTSRTRPCSPSPVLRSLVGWDSVHIDPFDMDRQNERRNMTDAYEDRNKAHWRIQAVTASLQQISRCLFSRIAKHQWFYYISARMSAVNRLTGRRRWW